MNIKLSTNEIIKELGGRDRKNKEQKIRKVKNGQVNHFLINNATVKSLGKCQNANLAHSSKLFGLPPNSRFLLF